MTDKPSIFDGVEYLYSENLKGKRVTVTIKKVVAAKKIGQNGTKQGWDVHLEETPKKLGVFSITLRRGMTAACGTDNPQEMAGQKIMLYAEKEPRSPSGEAIRIAKV